MLRTFRHLRHFRTKGAVSGERRHEAVIGHAGPVQATSRLSNLAVRWIAGPEGAASTGAFGLTAAPGLH